MKETWEGRRELPSEWSILLYKLYSNKINSYSSPICNDDLRRKGKRQSEAKQTFGLKFRTILKFYEILNIWKILQISLFLGPE